MSRNRPIRPAPRVRRRHRRPAVRADVDRPSADRDDGAPARAGWPRARAPRRPDGAVLGPYETSYEISHGYTTERRIILP